MGFRRLSDADMSRNMRDAMEENGEPVILVDETAVADGEIRACSVCGRYFRPSYDEPARCWEHARNKRR